ncbi:MAG: hypothetical protein OK422_03990 [Thaumarchaeota archaeon]|nr:hypothetical protein [Nitrososphaerota archaeon]
MDLRVSIRRNVRGEAFQFTELFAGFESVGAVKKIFGRDSGNVLRQVKVLLVQREGYLRVDNDTGDIILCQPYLDTADERHLYLDLIHELVHVGQFQRGKELYDKRYSYVDRPTEIEAYAVAVGEARRIGMSEDEIVDYLKVEWVSKKEFGRMLTNLGVDQSKAERKSRTVRTPKTK